MLLLTHRNELRRSSNTGRLVARTLEHARVQVYGLARGDSALPTAVDHPRPLWVLAPGPDAEILGPEHRDEAPATLVVIDGTWRQAGRWLHRNRATPGARWVTPPPGPPSAYRLRQDARPGRLSTLEATARALAQIEPDGAAVEARLLALLQVFVDRSLWMRGLLPADRVTGGVPPKTTG